MSRIIRLKSVYKDIYMKSDFHISHTVMKARQPRVFVKIEDNEGNYGLGEAASLPFFNGEEAKSIKTVIDQFLFPELKNLEVEKVTEAIEKMNQRLPGNYTAKAAIEMALWDLSGKQVGLPVYRLLGGKCRDQINIAYVLSLKEIPEMVQEARYAINKGYKTIKTKLSGDVLKDVEIISAIREVTGMEISLRADVNGVYSFKDGLFATRKFEPYRLEYLEQPCSKDQLKFLKYIRESTTTPIAADESLLSVNDAFKLINEGIVDHLVVKLIKVGGIFAGFKIANIAEMAGIKCTIVSPIETSIGVAAGLTLAAIAPAASVAHELNTREYLTVDLASGLQFKDSVCNITDNPGLGIQLIEDIFR